MTLGEYYNVNFKGLSAGAVAQKFAHLVYIRQAEAKANPLNALFKK